MIRINIEEDKKCEIRMIGKPATVIAEFAAMVDRVRKSFEGRDDEDIFKIAVLASIFDMPIEETEKAYMKTFKDGDSK